MTTKAQMRVKIARDVLKQIKAKKLVPRNGTYMDVGNHFEYFSKLGLLNPSIQFNTVLPTKCEVCALGAVFIAAVDKNNTLEIGELTYTPDRLRRYPSYFDMQNYLSKWFSREQLHLIESVFESNSDYSFLNFRKTVSDTPLRKIAASKMLTAIMKNIIKNKGTFVIHEG